MLSALAGAAKKGLKVKKKKKLTAAEKKFEKTLKKTAKVVKDKAGKKPDLLVSDKAKDMVGSARTKPRGIPPQRKGSVAKKANVSKSDIEQAKTKRALDAYENKVNAMKPGNIKTMLKKVIKDKRKAFENMQAGEKDKASRTASNAARSKKMKGKVTLAPEMNKGGMPKKNFAKPGSYSSAYNKGGMTMRKGNMAYNKGGVAKKK